MNITEAIKDLKEKEWEIEYNENQITDIYKFISSKRFPKLPVEYIEFFKNVKECHHKDGQATLFSSIDYINTKEIAFSWNFCEESFLGSLNEEEIKKTHEFWDNYLPIGLSVSGDYTYHAINLSEDFGAVYYGFAPEFKETVTREADSFNDFLLKLANGEIDMHLGPVDEEDAYDDEVPDDDLYYKLLAEVKAEEEEEKRKGKKK